MDKLDGKTMDIVKDNIEKLKELFPSIVKEDKIDFSELELLLGENINRNKEQYSFVWNGKTEATKLAQKRSTGTLRPCPEESKDWDTTKNLYIEGDNLEVLKLLQTSYNGRIKMIYIDPPYNTGHDFVYKDNFEDNIANYKEITGQAQKSNADTDGRYHTNWLNMMYPRLKLARTLLAKEGVIFISIDDNEQANLKKLCDDVFGEDNFVADIIWEKNYAPKNNAKQFSANHDYILCYSKSLIDLGRNLLPSTPEQRARYKNPDNDPRGDWKPSDFSTMGNSEKNKYDITLPSGRIVKAPAGRSWGCSKENFEQLIKENRIWFGPDGNSVPAIKKYISEVQDGMVPLTIWKYEDVGHTQESRQDLIRLMGCDTFDTPKPIKLIKRMLQIYTDKNSIILDFFSGSATTAHAVMQLNAEDGGNRQFVCVQLPEITEEGSEAQKAGYKNICEIGKERIRRAGEKIKKENPNVDLDAGFKGFKLDSSNLRKWNNEPTDDVDEVAKRLQLSLEYLEPNRTELDLVYEIMLKHGIDLTKPVVATSNGKGYIVEDDEYKLLICSQKNITLEDVESFINENVGTYIFADHCFSDDNLLINTQEMLKAKGREMKLF